MLFVVVFFLARVSAGRSSLVCLGARTRRESTNVRKGAKFFVFWLPRFNTFSPKFLDKKKRDTEREKETNEMEREREREILLISCWCFLSWEECFSLFFFVKVVCFLMSCVLERLCAFKRE